MVATTLMKGAEHAPDASQHPGHDEDELDTGLHPWVRAMAQRDEIRPRFDYKPKGGKDRKGALLIVADEREGLDGYWSKTFAITGGKHYRFFALRKVAGVTEPRRSAVVRILWQDENGKPVLRDEPVVSGYLKGARPVAEAEHPVDRATDADGWTEVSDMYRAPSNATRCCASSAWSIRVWASLPKPVLMP